MVAVAMSENFRILYLTNSLTDLHEAWHDDAEWVT